MTVERWLRFRGGLREKLWRRRSARRDESLEYADPVELARAEKAEANAAPHLSRDLRFAAEDVINDSFGLPPVWRCRCGGRPFVPKPCGRCGRSREEGEQ